MTAENPLKQFNFYGFLKSFGPGLIFAGTSIGVSHIVQSTRAGADYAFGLLWAVILVNIFKFPFFEFAPRYVIATGENFLQGYQRLGEWAFYLFFFLALCTMIPIQSAVTLVTTGLFVNLLHWPFPPVVLAAIILLICCLILLMGRYPLLDKLMKIMMIVLGISTVVAFLTAANLGSQAKPEFSGTFVWNLNDVSFLIALMGWMPTTLEIGVWHSFWTLERIKQTGHTPHMNEALLDFHIGYWGTMVMAALFLGLGALVMYGTGETFDNSAVKFTGQVVSLYTKALGSWSYPIIVAAASTTMFSTTISCLDAFPRVIREALIMIFPSLKGKEDQLYFGWIISIAAVSTLVIGVFVNSMKILVDFATIVAFLAAPIFAYINLRTVTSPHMPQESRPSKGLIVFSWLGIIFLGGFGVLFVVWKFLLL